jgi:hypothetical protein
MVFVSAPSVAIMLNRKSMTIPKRIKRHKPVRQKRKSTADTARRNKVRQDAWTLDRERCIWPSCRVWLSLEFAHEHEVEWRSHGGDPLDIDNVVTVCPRCHHDIHPRVGGLRKKMTGTRATGLHFWEKRGADWVEVAA